MKLRARIALSLLLASFFVILGLALFLRSQRRAAFLERTYERTLAQMEAGARERCEESPATWPRAPLLRQRPGPMGPHDGARPHGHWRARRMARRERRGLGGPARVFAYDAELRSLRPRAPALGAPLREGLEEEGVGMEWIDDQRVRVAMWMPWGEGPCAVIVEEQIAPAELGAPGELLRILLRAGGLAGVASLLVLLLLGPVVRRIRNLTAAVRRSAEGGYKEAVAAEGADEVAELARAWNAASGQIREQIAALEARDLALTEYVQHTTHDVMVPLNVLQGHLLAAQKAVEAEQPVDRERLRKALEESHYLASLMHNLSAAARLRSGAERPPPSPERRDGESGRGEARGDAGEGEAHLVELGEIVERAAERHRPIAEQRGIAVEHAGPEAPLLVEGDPTLIERAVSNLVHNAVRYNEDGGHVAVFAERRGEAGFRVTVLDDGPGIPEEEMSRIMEKRFRGGEARTRRPSGLGLGLHIVRSVIERHGWTIRFESPEEGGLRVVIEGEIATRPK